MNIDQNFENNAGMIDVAGRLLLAAIFILSGLQQIPILPARRNSWRVRACPEYCSPP